jgi:hypothetical protein
MLWVVIYVEGQAHDAKAQHGHRPASAKNMIDSALRRGPVRVEETHPIAISTPTTHGQKKALRTGGSISGMRDSERDLSLRAPKGNGYYGATPLRGYY